MATAFLAEKSSTPSPLWREVATAMTKAGAGSMASAVFAMLATKIVAAMLGPAYIALIQTLRQTQQAAAVAATLNGQTAVVQGVSSLTPAARREYLRTVLLLLAAAQLAVASVMLAAPETVARLCGLPAGSAHVLMWLTVAVSLSSLLALASGLLNALGEIGKVAVLQVLGPASLAAGVWPIALAVRRGHPAALVSLVVFPAAVSVMAAIAMLVRRRHTLAEWLQGPSRWWRGRSARHFLSISGAMLASSLASSAVLLAVRTRISRTQGLEVTGQFDAAWGISMNHATLVLASLQTYYLPALARARCAQERARYVAGVFKVATLVALPAIVAIAVLKPWVLTVLYSHAFRPAASYLRWTLIGDYLKIGCSVLSLPLVATADMRAFLIAEATALAAFIASASLISMVRTAAEGAAIGYVVCYAVHFAVCYGYARRRHEFRPGRKEAAIWAAGLAAVVGLSAIP